MDYEAGTNVNVHNARVGGAASATVGCIAEISGGRFFIVQCRKPIVAAILFTKIKGYAIAPCLEIFKRIVADSYFVAVCHKCGHAVGHFANTTAFFAFCWPCVSAYFERICAFDDVYFAIFDIDIQGYYLAMKEYNDIITSVFITTKDRHELKRRLIKRGSDDAQTIENRLFNAATEIAHIGEYDYLIINDDIDNAYERLKSIFISMSSKSQSFNINEVIESWNE